MITSRDLSVIDAIEKYKIMRTSTIAKLYFPSLLMAQKRLKTMVENKEVKRMRDLTTKEYCYYIRKPKQWRHSLLTTDFYAAASELIDIVSFQSEVTIEHLRCDGLIAYRHRGKGYVAFLEVQISNTPLDVEKYKKLLYSGAYKQYFGGVFPRIIAVTNRNIPQINDLTIIQVKEDLSNIEDILRK
ncbi:hypothetical protein HNQ80_001027 [Anaerosolibacter carboniphilus]|uniref:Uncharacterized protein n=1 Tax=Anaerosolibacter carboniphilus TaxID=1417629 RepID=A0A841KVJ0_9FIRM|nr:hypothetical protein [Anaerosolibacter carboniphilus]MBB6214942.1 hypothetical protein [Anaerosolibacter carboniphilus]